MAETFRNAPELIMRPSAIQLEKPQPNSRRVPGPRLNLLGIGALPLMRNPLGAVIADFDRYGDVVEYRLFNLRAYLLAHPDHVSHVLHENHTNYTKANVDYERLKELLGEGLLTSEGPQWLRQRRLIQPLFHRQQIAQWSSMMTASALQMLERWGQFAAERRTFDVSTQMMALTLRIVGETLLSMDISGEAGEIARALTDAQDHFGNFRLSTLLPFLPTAENRRFRAAVRTLDGIVRKIVDDRRHGTARPNDLLTKLLDARDPETGTALDGTQIRDELITLILAGHETTANALSWTWYLLGKNPGAETRLHAELRSVLGGRTPAMADLANLPYTAMVLNESMRLYPPAWTISRGVIEDDEIGGYRIPRGTVVMLSQYVTHRHPGFWETPERFDPERFSPERSENRPRFAYFPFGGGPRLCIGNYFALTEAQLILATIAQRYRLRLVPDHPVELDALITLRPRHGIRVTLEPIGT